MNDDIERGSRSTGSNDQEEGRVQVSEKQDELDHILGTATHLKEIGYEINEEIGVQIGLLEEIEDREDQLLAKQKRNDKLMRDWLQSKNGPLTCLWGLVVLFFMALIYVLMV